MSNLQEHELLNRADRWLADHAGQELSAALLQQISVDQGIDFATAVLIRYVLSIPPHRAAFDRMNSLREQSAVGEAPSDILLAIAPGAFYREYPHSGADGRLLQEQSAQLGCRSELIPSPSQGSVAENGSFISEWLQSRSNERIILASISKGGADIKAAMARPDAAQAFRPVIAWVSLCGILDGSPAVNWLLERKVRKYLYRLLFWSRGLKFQLFDDLRRMPGSPLDVPLNLPAHVRLLHIVGFPLQAHLTNRLSRVCHAACAPLGPNDGAILLSDMLHLPGEIYPVWGADHYLRPSWALRSLASAAIRYAVEVRDGSNISGVNSVAVL